MNTTGTTSTASTPRDKPINLRELQMIVERLQAVRDPLEDWMTVQGFAPAQGGRLALPDTAEMRARFGEGLLRPWYCGYSAAISTPMLYRDMVDQAKRDLAAGGWAFTFGSR